ncbi:MAG: UDP-N-acetylmuramoyl-tripeptide--D-alanyl-D-alanine ligase [Bacteroidetes bacterium]|nr:UDP-N-acetylmuramoyl-tripeptide--D-alanyl-D-alanine ligase [Bacteroidota bacterium]
MNEWYARFDARVGVCSDSRTLASGQIFFALRGASFNGNLFAPQALALGASTVVVDELVEGLNPEDDRVVHVPDALKALQGLAHYHRMKWGKTVVGLTGSNGKTTAKELFAHVLQQKFAVLATQGNLNNHIGVPLTLLRLLPEHDIAVVEMGANHQGEIDELSRIAAPNLGYITNFGLAHLEGFGGPEGVIKGKSELYRYLAETGGRALVYYGDARQLAECTSARSVFGEGLKFAANEHGQMRVEWNRQWAQSHLIGDFQDRALAAAVALGAHLGLSDDEVARGIEAYVPNNNRGEWRSINGYQVFMDAYNANPSSMEASLRNAAPRLEPEDTVYVAGDLFELGGYAAEAHQKMVDLMVALGITRAVLVGPLFEATRHPYTSVRSTEELAQEWRRNPPKCGRIWVKGSRGMALERAIAALGPEA